MRINASSQIRGSTKIITLLESYPDGKASSLMSDLGWACTHCSARMHEPLSLAAKRHGNSVKAVLKCFRALDEEKIPSELIMQAKTKRKKIRDSWQQHTKTALSL